MSEFPRKYYYKLINIETEKCRRFIEMNMLETRILGDKRDIKDPNGNIGLMFYEQSDEQEIFYVLDAKIGGNVEFINEEINLYLKGTKYEKIITNSPGLNIIETDILLNIIFNSICVYDYNDGISRMNKDFINSYTVIKQYLYLRLISPFATVGDLLKIPLFLRDILSLKKFSK